MKRCLISVATFLFRLLVFATVIAAFFGVPYCWVSVKAQRFLWGVVLTALFGRFFCRSICPLGMLQSFVNWICHPKTHVRRVCTRLPETKAQRAVRWPVVAVCVILGVAGFVGPVTMLLPISIFGKALTLWWPGVAVCAVVLLLSAFDKGRVWCNWICPFGTVFSLIAKVTPCKDKVGKGCGNCRRCFKNGEADSRPLQKKEESSSSQSGQEIASPLKTTRREALKGVAVLAVTEKLSDGGYADVSLPGAPEREKEVLPPGAGDRRLFALRCASCQLCVANCPGKCIRPSVRLAAFGQPVMDFRHGYCLIGCTKCSRVCPANALRIEKVEHRPHVHMGYAVWKKDLCVRTTSGDDCKACARKCPVRAIHLVKGFPVVDRDVCIGCGACEHVCPARPQPAICVKGYEVQRTTTPITEADLVREMKSRLDAGMAVVVARGGMILATENGRGLTPLLKLFDTGKLSGSIVMDKVIGRAAAAICAEGGVTKVFALLAGKGAAAILERYGISLVVERIVDEVLNRENTGACPMEVAVSGLDDPKEMVEAVRKTLEMEVKSAWHE